MEYVPVRVVPGLPADLIVAGLPAGFLEGIRNMVAAKSSEAHTYEFSRRNPFVLATCKIVRLNRLWNEYIRKKAGGPPIGARYV
jgi:hypothetical protein